MSQVKMYIKDTCPHCKKLMEELTQQGIAFQTFVVNQDPHALREAKEIYGADRVPVLVEGDKVTCGYHGGFG